MWPARRFFVLFEFFVSLKNVACSKKLNDGNYDILILDGRGELISFRQDGGEIMLIRKGIKDATFIHIHPGMVTAIYTFYRDNNGDNRFDQMQSKGGDNMFIHLSSVLTGKCKPIQFDLIQ